MDTTTETLTPRTRLLLLLTATFFAVSALLSPHVTAPVGAQEKEDATIVIQHVSREHIEQACAAKHGILLEDTTAVGLESLICCDALPDDPNEEGCRNRAYFECAEKQLTLEGEGAYLCLHQILPVPEPSASTGTPPQSGAFEQGPSTTFEPRRPVVLPGTTLR